MSQNALMRRSRSDANQSTIVDALRKAGWKVDVVSPYGLGYDLIVGKGGDVFILEVKRDDVPPSERQLTENEQRQCDGWNARCPGIYRVVTSPKDALEAISRP